MASSSSSSVIIGIPQHHFETELRELPRTPPTTHHSPIRTTPVPPPPPQSPNIVMTTRSTTPHAQVMISNDKSTILSSTTNLLKLLPSGTVLAFQALSPSFTNKGSCYTSNKYLISALILLCSLSCILLSFTDSLVGRDGKLYYGFATLKGMYLFNYDGTEEEKGTKVVKDLGRFRIRLLDFVHAFLSVLVFLALTFGDSNTQSCLFPDAGMNEKELLLNLPLGIAVMSSLVFMIFPTSRKGIGYSDTTTTTHSQ